MANVLKELLESKNDYADATHLVEVEGLSTARVCNLLNDMVASIAEDEYYLEIGTWKGLTLCSAIHGNEGKKAIACDKFRVWGKWTGWGTVAKKTLLANVAKYSKGGADVTFHHMTSKKLFADGLVPHNVKVYFYDGDHSYEGTRHGIYEALPFMTDESYVLVDDWNDKVIRDSTYEAFKQRDVEILWERSLEGKNGDPQGWWNGLGGFWIKKP